MRTAFPPSSPRHYGRARKPPGERSVVSFRYRGATPTTLLKQPSSATRGLGVRHRRDRDDGQHDRIRCLPGGYCRFGPPLVPSFGGSTSPRRPRCARCWMMARQDIGHNGLTIPAGPMRTITCCRRIWLLAPESACSEKVGYLPDQPLPLEAGFAHLVSLPTRCGCPARRRPDMLPVVGARPRRRSRSSLRTTHRADAAAGARVGGSCWCASGRTVGVIARRWCDPCADGFGQIPPPDPGWPFIWAAAKVGGRWTTQSIAGPGACEVQLRSRSGAANLPASVPGWR